MREQQCGDCDRPVSTTCMQVSQQALHWLAEQLEVAAELAALLSAAALKVGLNALKSKLPGINRAKHAEIS